LNLENEKEIELINHLTLEFQVVILNKLESVTEELKVIRQETILSGRNLTNPDNLNEEIYNHVLLLKDRNGIEEITKLIEQP